MARVTCLAMSSLVSVEHVHTVRYTTQAATDTDTDTQTHKHTDTQTHMYTHTHTRTHIHTRTAWLSHLECTL